MVKIVIAIDTEKSAREFSFGWIFQRMVRPIIELRQCLWFEITDDNPA